MFRHLIKKKKKCFFVNWFSISSFAWGLRMLLQIVGEVIYKVDIHIGFLYRSSEKLITTIIFIKALPSLVDLITY
jgi:NADH:ubiquinone oxidoreductase subunit D